MIWYDLTMPKASLDLRQGNYQKVIDQVTSAKTQSVEDLVALIGAHCFLGGIEKARQIWGAHGASFQNADRIQARFFLGIALTRVSKFKQARSFLQANLNEATTPAAQAFAFQGAGFFSYFRGNFARAARFSKKALRFATLASDRYIEYLAMDLLGHATVQAGQRSEGLRLLRDASHLASQAKNVNFAAAFRDARLVYEAEAGLRSQTIVGELVEVLRDPKLADSYTRSNLILELTRQLTLRGRFEEAKEIANREATVIYSFGNKRQAVMLQLRLAELAYQQGDYHSVNHLLQSVKQTVAILSDRAFEIRLLGLSLKIPPELTSLPAKESRQRLLLISTPHSSLINRQMLYRASLARISH